MIEIPENLTAVPEHALAAVSAEATKKISVQTPPRRVDRRFDIDQWLQSSGLEIIKGPDPYNDGRKWTLRNCVFNSAHEKPVVIELSQGGLAYKCLHQSCKENDWKALREYLDPTRRDRTSEGTGHGNAGQPRATGPDLRYQPATDTGNAERLLALFGSDIRYCSEMKKWLVWDGRRWTGEKPRRVWMLAKRTVRRLYEQATEIETPEIRAAVEKHARKSESAAGIKAMLTCAESEEGVAVSAVELDCDPYLLNVMNGTLDLQTGKLRDHRRGDLITRLVRFDYRTDAKCPAFLKFLGRIMGDSGGSLQSRNRATRLIDYLQKCLGYALTGDVSEKAIFCFFGEGNNGKTTLLDIIRFILTEYSTQVLIDNLMSHTSRENSSSLADLADLRGARFVTTSEAEEGQRLAVAKLKYLSQGMGELKTCRKYENPIKFRATHKLFIDANHRPVIRGAEKAIWNRLKPFSFETVIPKEEINTALPEELQSEAEGILAWLVEGCRRWRQEGLGDPPEIGVASAAWQAESDRLPAFLEECCIVRTYDADIWMPVSELWPAFQAWSERNSEKFVQPKVKFDERILKLGCRQAKKNNGTLRVWMGIRLKESTDDLQTEQRDNGTSRDTEF